MDTKTLRDAGISVTIVTRYVRELNFMGHTAFLSRPPSAAHVLKCSPACKQALKSALCSPSASSSPSWLR